MRSVTDPAWWCSFEDGRVELDTNALERAIRPVALGRKNALFAGSYGGAQHWGDGDDADYTAKLNGIEPMACLTDVLERIVSGHTKSHELRRLLPWTWQPATALDTHLVTQPTAA